MGKDLRIDVRVSDQEKRKIAILAKRCGLSVSQYAIQRALGYTPRAVPPEAVFQLLEQMGDLQDKAKAPETDAAIRSVMDGISEKLLFAGKEDVAKWQSQDFGP